MFIRLLLELVDIRYELFRTMPLVTWKFELSVSANSVERNYYQEYSDSNVNPNLIL